MADHAPSRAVVQTTAPKALLVDSTERASEAAVYTTVILSGKKAMVNSTVLSCCY
jgi:hypothetical protein